MPTAKTQKASARTDQATMVVSVYDATRQLIGKGEFLIRIFDGFQNQLFDDYKPAPTTLFRLPYRDNLQDNCTVLASGKAYVDAGFTPVKLSLKAVALVDLMLIPDNANFQFIDWNTLKSADAVASNFIATGSSDAEAQAHYEDLRQTKPAALASLLNLITAMKAIQLPSKTPLDYFKEILWNESLAQDRFFGYADRSMVDQVRRASLEGEFAPEPSPGLFHPDATSSYKQIQFGEANVQLTFHEKDTKKIDGVVCVKVEPDIDYYKDLGAHTLLEVIPNSITHGLTDPKKVYVLRWIAGKRAGVPEFAPPYTIGV
ncbi:MAG: hypothetical protein DMG30_19760 [Acidobacteria bacterium]|nr:MAG: hypothetical protein DMG30_19760 [Acidobacteriota bacterium]